MAQPPSRSKCKLLWLVLIPAISFLLLGTIGCEWLNTLFPGETRAPEKFPDTDIVFVTNDSVGFVNADGSNAAYVPLTVKAYGNASDFWRPVITGDNRTLFVKVMDSYDYVFDRHYLAVWHAGELPVLCTQWGYQQMPLLASDQAHIFINTEQGMALYELDSCGTDNAPMKVYENVFGIPSPNLQYLVYVNDQSASASDDRFIVIHNLANGEERTVGIGDYPAWSRDGQWLAYTGKDGIYIVNVAEGAEPQRVVLYPNPFEEGFPTYYEAAYWRIPPEVSWSPDGKWLVYNRWIGTDYYTGVDPLYNSIYKLNIETGEETKIIDGGMYPFWRWPAQP